MTTLAVNDVSSINSNQQSKLINEILDEGNIILIFFHPNNELDNFNKRIDHFNNDIIFHTELESCINFIQSIRKQKKIFLIIPYTQLTIPLINFDQIENIFIFSLDNNQNTDSSLQNSKIIGIYDNIDLLCSSIQEQIDYIENENSRWCFFDQNEYSTKDLSKQVNDFLWFQLFHEVLAFLPFEKQIKRRKLDDNHFYNYRHNLRDLKLLDEFEKIKYQSKQTALDCFIQNLSIQNMINKALQTENINLLYTLRDFIVDLINNLSQQIVQSNQNKLIVYRQMNVSNDEFKQILNNKGNLMAMKGFLIAYTDRPSSIEEMDRISVLFEIECDIKNLSHDLILADITPSSSSGQRTILFDFNTTFRLENIQQKDGIWIMKLHVVNDGRSILRKYIDDTHRQIEDLSLAIIFGKFLCDRNKWNQSQEYFERLMNDSSDEDLAWIEQSLGQAYQWKNEWDKARQYYNNAYDRMIQCEPIRIKDSAIVLFNIGEILYAQGKYEESWDFHQQALTIRKEYFPSNHSHIAISLTRIAMIQYQRQKEDEALTYFKKALIIQEEYYQHFHIHIAVILSNIGNILASQENCETALDYHQRAIIICEKYDPSGHLYIATILNRICFILRRQGKYDEGFKAVQRALNIQKKFYPFGHIDIAMSICNVGRVKYRQNKFDESLELCYQTLMIERKYSSSSSFDHLELVYTWNIIGFTQLYGKKNYDEALSCHQQALQILERCYPSYHAHIALTLNYIGNVSRKQMKYDEALNFFYQALKILDDYYLSDTIDKIVVLNDIGKTLVSQEKFDEAFDYHQRALTIRQKYQSPSHMNIILALETLADVRQKQRKLDEAIDYFQQALALLEQYHYKNYDEITYFLEHIACVFFEKSFYTRSAEYFERCLRISEASFPSTDSSSIVRTLSNLGLVQRNRDEYELSLFYELKYLSICEKLFPPNHEDLGKNLFNIGKCYQELNQIKIALEYYKRTLIIYEQCLPVDNVDRKNIIIRIQQLSEAIGQSDLF